VRDIPTEVRDHMRFTYVRSMDEVLELALLPHAEPGLADAPPLEATDATAAYLESGPAASR
jgi:hypothetical protein